MQPQGGFTIILTTTIFTPGWEEYEGLRVRRGSLENEKMEKQFLSWSRQQVKYPSNQLISCTLLCKEDTILSAQSYVSLKRRKYPLQGRRGKKNSPLPTCMLCTAPASGPTVMWVPLPESTDHVFLPHVFL